MEERPLRSWRRTEIPCPFLQNLMSIPPKFDVYSYKIPCPFLQNSMSVPLKFHVYSSKILICTLLTVSLLQWRKDKWLHVRKQWSCMCGECKRICDKKNSFHYNLRPNFVYSHEEIRSNSIRGKLAAFQFRTRALHSTRISKERSPKYENNNSTSFLYDEKSGHILKKVDYLPSIFEKRVWRQKGEE